MDAPTATHATKAGDGDSKRARILDAAEALFAIHGYDGVTLRQIAAKAGVDVALPNYHFGPKRDVFDAVVSRRATILNDMRREALERCCAEAAPAAPSLEQIIEAFLRPLEVAQEKADTGWRNYLALVAYINSSPVWGRDVMSKHFNPLVSRFIDALRAALPGAKPAHVYWCYQHLSGSLSLTLARTGRIDALSGGLARADDFKTAYDTMIPFVCAGFRAVCKSR
ncbi:MAG: TetR/AcrR family transcriptional regulator [Alphaproteobacteria bacterium]|nr:MAG: TetR/AcrR family transcriptional regulator [Alphaproteobacteria bacterium]